MGSQGWVPELYDERDKPYRFKGNPDTFSQAINLPALYPQGFGVYDQFSTGSCVANATAAAYRYAAFKAKLQSPVVVDPSRLFIWWNARALPSLDKGGKMPATLPDRGCQNRDAFKGLNVFGTCSENTWPFKNIVEGETVTRRIGHATDIPPLKAYQEAIHGRVLEYCRLDPDHPDAVGKIMTRAERDAVGVVTLGLLKQCLNEGYPVVFGFWFYWKNIALKKDPNDGHWVLGDVPADRRGIGPDWSLKNGGHTVLAVGFDEAKKRVLIQNSWGPKTEEHENGRFWMPYSWILDWEATDDFWMLRFIDSNAPATLEKRIVDQVS